jgi:hypothetical protein
MSYADAEQQYILWKDVFSEVKELPLWSSVTDAIKVARFELLASATVALLSQTDVDMAYRVSHCINSTWSDANARVDLYICIGAGSQKRGDLVIQLN